jgi:hypothetical protein
MACAQVTVFMALLVLDAKRLAQSRLDCLPCLRVPYRDATGTARTDLLFGGVKTGGVDAVD